MTIAKRGNPMNMPRQTLQCRLKLEISGGMTASIFPAVDGMLNETDFQKSLEFVGARKDMERYRSMVDFLFCEVFIQYRYGCFKFYEDETKYPQLKKILTADQVKQYGRWLVAALQLAREMFEKKLALTWTTFRCQVLTLAA